MDIKTVGVVGAGTMGQGIAQIFVCAGFGVLLVDLSDATLKNAVESIGIGLDRLVKKDKLTIAAKQDALSRIATSADYARLGTVDFVIEAATENLDAKLRILRQIAEAARDDVVMASNTSSISITRLAAAVPNPARFVGMHFFNPVPVLPLVEIVRGLQTGKETVETVRDLTDALGRTPIVVNSSPGFVVNRLLVPMINEAFCLLAEGVASAEEIDAGMKLGANHPIGPLALADMVGLDVCLAVMDIFHADFGDPKYRASPLLREMVSAGYQGRKSSRGVYDYKSGHA
ncbi:3-hydroxybutyryl-CoA dehydrogenase [Paraburkholderia sediminicola]|uniref:3-hydroxybutyryl-CoA dehydrogenase n=1 Tax=Paraburkholderia rhynchosiae TaxID=487049 RepID=A0ACC7NNJ6_9BURK